MLTNKFRHLIDSEKLEEAGYGLEAIKRLRSGRSIIYSDGGIIIEEHPDGRRFEMALDEQKRPLTVRSLPPRRIAAK